MVNGNGTRPQDTNEELYTLILHRHEILFLTQALKEYRALIRYSLMRKSDISFEDDRMLDTPLEDLRQKYCHSLDFYIRKLFVDLDKLMHPYMH